MAAPGDAGRTRREGGRQAPRSGGFGSWGPERDRGASFR